MTRHGGRCHCGAITFEFETEQPLSPRACQCGFCLKQGARTVSDHAGSATLTFDGPVRRYRFAIESSDYILCATCGVYVGAVAEIDGARYAILDLKAFDDPHSELPAEPVSYEGESAAEKAARRAARWTPLRGAD